MLISTQHQEGIDRDTVIRPDLIDQVIRPTVPEQFADDDYEIYINPTGKFVLGGPYADCGLTGRKIIVDTYGGMGRHGGGAFSGKDPSKVDRSAAYAGRWVAKHVVASGAADRCEIQLAYAIGMAQPMSILVETFGTANEDPAKIEAAVRVDVRPSPGRDRPRSRPQASDLQEVGGLRSLRPRRVPVGTARQARRPEVGPRRLNDRAGEHDTAEVGLTGHRWRGCFPTSPGSTSRSTTRSPTICAREVRIGTIVRVDLHGRRIGGWVVELLRRVGRRGRRVSNRSRR